MSDNSNSRLKAIGFVVALWLCCGVLFAVIALAPKWAIWVALAAGASVGFYFVARSCQNSYFD